METCSLIMAVSMSLQIALTQIQEFNGRNFDLLFSKFYSPQLEVYQHPDFFILKGLIIILNDKSIPLATKEHALSAAIEGHDHNIFPDIEVLKGHVKKQFASPLELHVDVLEQASIGNYAVLFERKKRDGIVVDAVDVYYIENGMIRKMWIAKAHNGEEVAN